MNDNSLTTKEAIIVVIVAILLIGSLKMLWAHFVYGDAICAFAECRKEIK